MVEIGTSGWPWRASGIAIGTALAAETDGAHVVWFADRIPLPITADDWTRSAGPLLPLVPDPADVADPVVTAAAALLVTRHVRVGILGWSPGADAARAARTLASLADLAPDRAVVALAGDGPTLAAVAAELGRGADRARRPRRAGRGRRRARLGLDRGRDPARRARQGRRGRRGHRPARVCTSPSLVHADAEVARRALDAPLLAPLADAVPADGMVVGDPERLGAVDRRVRGARRRPDRPRRPARLRRARPARGRPGRGPGRDPRRPVASPPARRRRRRERSRAVTAPTVAELARRDLFWKVRADPRRADLELGTRAGVLPYFVPVGSPLGREVVVDGRAPAHVRVEQLSRARRRPPGDRGGPRRGRRGTAPGAPGRG